jgi:hypothetical protein
MNEFIVVDAGKIKREGKGDENDGERMLCLKNRHSG